MQKADLYSDKQKKKAPVFRDEHGATKRVPCTTAANHLAF